MKTITKLTGMLLPLCLLAAAPAQADSDIERGRYLIATSGCNDCHTAGYPQADGRLPVEQWLTGSPVGFQGPWGTTYPANLRLTLDDMTREEWLARARSPMRPPMPWFSLRDMSDMDLLAIYDFVRSLGRAGAPAPAYAAPGQAVMTPYFDFVPKNLPVSAKLAE